MIRFISSVTLSVVMFLSPIIFVLSVMGTAGDMPVYLFEGLASIIMAFVVIAVIQYARMSLYKRKSQNAKSVLK